MSKGFPTVGIIGAGQLARMSVAPAAALGINLILFAESPQDSAAQICQHVVGDYKNLNQLKSFAEKCDVLTFEHELVPLSVIKGLEAAGVCVYPTSTSFEFSQDKAAMRKRLTSFPGPKSEVISDASAVSEFPVVAKKISGGYDGRGVWKIKSEDELVEVLKSNPTLLVEELINFDYEVAVMVARSPHGQATSWAPTQTIQEEGSCTSTITPAPIFGDE